MHLKRLHTLINVLVITECSAAAIDNTTNAAAVARDDADKARQKLNTELLALEAQIEALRAKHA